MTYLPVALLGASAGIGAWAWRRSPRLGLGLAGVMLALLLFKAAVGWLPAAEARLFPWDWYPPVEGWWYLLPGACLLGAGLVALRGSVWKRDAVLTVLGLLVVRETLISWESRFDHARLRGVVDASGRCIQTSTYSCGAASAAMLLHRHGVATTEREMALLCGTRPFGGTTEAGLLRGLRRKLPGRTLEIRVPRYEEIPPRSLVSLRHDGGVAHCVLVEEVWPDRIVLMDPAVGRRNVPREVFEPRWRGSAISVLR